MYNLSSLLFSLFLAFPAVAASPYDTLIGCYDAVSINGKPTASGGFESSIWVGNVHSYYNLDNSDLNGLVASIVIREQASTSEYSPHAFLNAPGAILKELGPQELNFSFHGKIKSRRDWRVHTLKYSTNFKKLADGMLQISSESDDENDRWPKTSNTFILKPTVCKKQNVGELPQWK